MERFSLNYEGVSPVTADPCAICNRVRLWRDGANPFVIHEFPQSLFVIGDHQFHPGYSLLLLKPHVRELHELSPAVQASLFGELMAATAALVRTFHPWKMNHASYGNLDQHVHWHLIPRYDSHADHQSHPWLHADQFPRYKIDSDTARELANKVRQNLD
jgi:diadenosine tetraphosphate (Ap4A) HIT family hydrolase